MKMRKWAEHKHPQLSSFRLWTHYDQLSQVPASLTTPPWWTIPWNREPNKPFLASLSCLCHVCGRGRFHCYRKSKTSLLETAYQFFSILYFTCIKGSLIYTWKRNIKNLCHWNIENTLISPTHTPQGLLQWCSWSRTLPRLPLNAYPSHQLRFTLVPL